MPIRDYSQPSPMGISPHLQQILIKNGMAAEVRLGGDNQLMLLVQGHDSPTLSYPITEAQLRKLSRADGATGSGLKAAYKTFTSIVGKDFYMPVDLTHAKNVNNRVSMGLHGYRIGHGEPGSIGCYYRPILAWTPSHQGGYHLRRMAGTVFYGGGPYVPDRPGGQLKPGELSAGGYGFYWKGTANGKNFMDTQSTASTLALNNAETQEQLLNELSQITIQKANETPKAKKYSDEITSDVYFSGDKFLEILSSHGIIVDAQKKEMFVRSQAVNFDMHYLLTTWDAQALSSDSLEEYPVEKRIQIINDTYGNDFLQQLTFEDLESDSPIYFQPCDGVMASVVNTDLSNQNQYENGVGNAYGDNGVSIGIGTSANNTSNSIPSQGQYEVAQSSSDPNNYSSDTNNYPSDTNNYNHRDPNLVSQLISPLPDGTTPIYVPQAHDVDVQEYYRVQASVLHADPKQVAQVNGEDINYLNPQKGWYREGNHGREVIVDQILVYPIESEDGKKPQYMMTAVINGEMVTHKISQKDYDKFLALDDFHRMKLFSKIFPEVDLKDHNQVGLGTKIVAGIAAGLTVASEVMRPMPVYGPPGHGYGSVYFKPRVDTPSDIAHRAFEAGMNTQRMDCDLHHGW